MKCVWLVIVAACSSKTPDAPAPAPAPPPTEAVIAPVIPPPLLPFELPPPKDPIVALGGSCVVRKSGHVDCWDKGVVTRVPDIDGAIAVRANRDERCVVRRTTITCTPLGEYDDGEGTKFGALIDPVGVVVGYLSCALLKSGAVMCVDPVTSRVPKLDAVALASGKNLVCAVERTGHVSCSGSEEPHRWQRVAKLEHVKLLGIGAMSGSYGPWTANACAVHSDGELECFEISGLERGAIKIEPITDETFSPPRAMWGKFRGATALSMDEDQRLAVIVDGHVVAYDHHGVRMFAQLTDAIAISDQCALRAQGSVICWGDNSKHGAGQPIHDEAKTPQPVIGVNDVVSVELAFRRWYAVRRDGKVFEWGDGDDGWAVPHAQALPPVARVVHGTRATCFLRIDGGVTCELDSRLVDLKLHDITALEPAKDGFVALGSDGTAYLWRAFVGRGVDLVPISTVAGTTRITGNGELMCLVDRAGKAWCSLADCWHGGVIGPRCKGMIEPVLDHVVELVASRDTACARIESGAVMCWGANNNGELGRPKSRPDAVPKPVAQAAGAIALSDHDLGFCAALADGSLVCWGGLDDQATAPHQVLPKTSVAGRFVGGRTGCTIGRDRLVRCWGSNQFGVLGDGSVLFLDEPAAVPGL